MPEWIRTSKPRLVFRYEISDLFHCPLDLEWVFFIIVLFSCQEGISWQLCSVHCPLLHCYVVFLSILNCVVIEQSSRGVPIHMSLSCVLQHPIALPWIAPMMVVETRHPWTSITFGITFFKCLIYFLHVVGVRVAQNAFMPALSSVRFFGLNSFRR